MHGPSIEISGSRLSQNYIICPKKTNSGIIRPSLGITLPYLVFIVQVTPPSKQQLNYQKQSIFSFEVTILDDKQLTRRFRASTYQSTTQIKRDICHVPLRFERRRRWLVRDSLLLPAKKDKAIGYNRNSYSHDNNNNDEDDINNEDGIDGEDDADYDSCWNRLSIPLSQYTRRAYGTNYAETMWVQIHGNCQLKRVYFAENDMNEDDELPDEFRLYYIPS